MDTIQVTVRRLPEWLLGFLDSRLGNCFANLAINSGLRSLMAWHTQSLSWWGAFAPRREGNKKSLASAGHCQHLETCWTPRAPQLRSTGGEQTPPRAPQLRSSGGEQTPVPGVNRRAVCQARENRRFAHGPTFGARPWAKRRLHPRTRHYRKIGASLGEATSQGHGLRACNFPGRGGASSKGTVMSGTSRPETRVRARAHASMHVRTRTRTRTRAHTQALTRAYAQVRRSRYCHSSLPCSKNAASISQPIAKLTPYVGGRTMDPMAFSERGGSAALSGRSKVAAFSESGKSVAHSGRQLCGAFREQQICGAYYWERQTCGAYWERPQCFSSAAGP